jgi:hypothetical protein
MFESYNLSEDQFRNVYIEYNLVNLNWKIKPEVPFLLNIIQAY